MRGSAPVLALVLLVGVLIADVPAGTCESGVGVWKWICFAFHLPFSKRRSGSVRIVRLSFL